MLVETSRDALFMKDGPRHWCSCFPVSFTCPQPWPRYMYRTTNWELSRNEQHRDLKSCANSLHPTWDADLSVVQRVHVASALCPSHLVPDGLPDCPWCCRLAFQHHLCRSVTCCIVPTPSPSLPLFKCTGFLLIPSQEEE